MALKNMQVIIISHKRYIDLCLNEKERKIFTHDRHTLIIDEKVNFPIYTYSDPFYSEIRKYISFTNRQLYDEVCDILNQILEGYKDYKTIQKVMPEIDEGLLSEFTKMMKGEIDSREDLQSKRALSDFLETVEICFDSSTQKVINSNKIDTLNRKHKFWGLKNNIILDASAGIDGVYLCNKEKFTVQKQTPFIDHSDSDFIHIKLNSSKSNIMQNQESYFTKMLELIKERQGEEEKTLLVLHKSLVDEFYRYAKSELGESDIWIDKLKQNSPDYNGQSYAIGWYGNLIGTNWAKDFDNIYILATPNIPYTNYLVHYMQYSGQPLGKKGLSIHNGKFKNPHFKDIQVGYITAEIYQALKRIQRNAKPTGKFYIVLNDEKVVKKVLSPIRNAQITETIEISLSDEEKKPTKQQAIVNHMLQLIATSEDKTHITKKEIAKLYGTGIRWDRITSHPKLIELKKSGRLVEQQRYFVVHKKVDRALKRKVE